jgi:hypothetical protein
VTTTPEPAHEPGPEERGAIHEFAGGEVRTYSGRVNRWLLVVYVILALWAVYYLAVHWGGLGPGLEVPR